MSYFEGQDAGWSQRHSRQQSWDPANSHARTGGVVSALPQDEPDAFRSQFEEIERTIDTLSKSGKLPGQFGVPPHSHNRRESMPAVGTFSRQLAEFDPRGAPRPFSMSEDHSRGHTPHRGPPLQGYLAHQRFGPRPSEAEQVMQAKRRAAAQRERELRNYHQEQQYNRNSSGPKSDRSMSPNAAMSEEDRRELIARQHRALYGSDSQLYMPEGQSPRALSQDARALGSAASPHGSSPLAFDAFGAPVSAAADAGVPISATAGPVQSSTRASSATPPSTSGKPFGMFDAAGQQAIKNSPSSASPAQGGPKGGPVPSVAPIGTRPAQAAGKAGILGTPSAPSPLGFSGVNNPNERSQSSASNPSNGNGDKAPGLGWSGSNGPWGSKMQASVWG